MILRIYTDIHLFSPMYDGTKLKDISDSYFIGDVVDLANCDKKELLVARKLRFKLVIESKGWCDGNHCRTVKYNHFIKPSEAHGVIMVHGDFESWGEKKAVKYRSKPQGAGFFKRQIWARSLKQFEKLYSPKPSKKMIRRLVKKAKTHKCNIIICGHLHPHKPYDRIHDGVRIIVLPRGYNEVEV